MPVIGNGTPPKPEDLIEDWEIPERTAFEDGLQEA
jgi:hypothetical protein